MSSVTVLSTKDASANKEVTGANWDGWNGNDEHNPVGRVSSGFAAAAGDWLMRSFSYFPISFTGMTTIESATLWFMQDDRNGHCVPTAGTTLDVHIYRMLRDFGEAPNMGEGLWRDSNSNNWKYSTRAEQTTSGTANWTTEGAAEKSFTQSNNSWVSADVTDIVTAWWNNSKGSRSDAPNYGIIFVNDDEAARGKGWEFYTRDESSARTPYIVVVYNSNNAPSAPATSTLNPRGDTIVNTLTPTFTGSNNDADTGDYITAYEILVYQDDGTTPMWDSGQVSQTGHLTTFSAQYFSVQGILPDGGTPLTGNTFYKWKVRTADKGGLWSPYSTLQRFKVNSVPNTPTVSLVQTPTNDITTLTPTISVTHNDPDPGDTKMYGYEVIVELASGVVVWDSGAADTSGTPATNKQVSVPTLTDTSDSDPWGTAFRVKARTKDSNGAWSNYCNYVSFTTHRTGTPINLSPSGSAIASSATPTFTFDRASTADTITSFDIVVYQDDLTPITWSGGLAQTTTITNGANVSKLYSGPALTQGVAYQWKARVVSSIGGTSAYSALQRFVVPSDPTVPSSTSPLGSGIQGGGSNALRPAFVGSRASTFNRYQIEVYPSTSTDSNLGSSFYASGTQSSTISGSGPYVFTLAADTVTALSWNTTYKWRARVSADAGSTWSSWSPLVSFTMDSAGTPTLTSPASDAWITDSTPDLTITRAGSDTIDQMQVLVYDSNGTTLLWDSTMTNVTNATTGTITYAGPTLTGGWYWWQARYQKTTSGPIGNYSAKQRFRLNNAPSVPTDLAPLPNTILSETLTPTFEARFVDADIDAMGDYPAQWDIVVEELSNPGVSYYTANITTNLVVGVNSYVYAGTTLVYGTDYQWKTRFKDSQGAWGPYSGYQVFRPSTTPDGDIATPTTGSNVTSVRPTVTWSYDDRGGTDQYGVTIKVYEIVDPNDTDIPPDRLSGATDDEVWVLKGTINKPVLTAATYTFESNYFQDGKVYAIELTVKNEEGLSDPTPSTVRVYVVLDAPDAVTGLSPTVIESQSAIELNWTVSTMKSGHTFVGYRVYKRLLENDNFTLIGETTDRTTGNTFTDYYAGNDVLYEYRVTVVTTKSGVGVELESGDDSSGGNTSESELQGDIWIFIGEDRDPMHIIELPVSDEDHTANIQQEVFETLGANRKTIIRGFVLGDEGNLSMTFMNADVASPADFQDTINETLLGRRLFDYMTDNAGPHILKSPFGDVWIIQVEGPKYKWLPAGHLQVDVSWIETGTTPDLGI